MTRRAQLTQAEIARICKAAPDRVVELRLPDGTVIRLVPPVATEGEERELAKVKEINL